MSKILYHRGAMMILRRTVAVVVIDHILILFHRRGVIVLPRLMMIQLPVTRLLMVTYRKKVTLKTAIIQWFQTTTLILVRG